MSTLLSAPPSRKDEAWRYADLAAVKAAWPLAAPEVIRLAEGDSLSQAIIHNQPGVRRLRLHLSQGARAALYLLNCAKGYGRVEIEARLETGSQLSLDAVQIGGGDARLEIISSIDHSAPDAMSRQAIRSVLTGKAEGSFLGKVHVGRGAQRIDAEQQVKALLLSRGAKANARPELEIYADDVKCAHGASVGALDQDALFYLQTRGLAPDMARRLLVVAFVGALFDDAPGELVEPLRAALRAGLEEQGL